MVFNTLNWLYKNKEWYMGRKKNKVKSNNLVLVNYLNTFELQILI